LKKQSQFASEQNGVNSYLKGDYGKNRPSAHKENKANSKPNKFVLSSVEWTQFQEFDRRSDRRYHLKLVFHGLAIVLKSIRANKDRILGETPNGCRTVAGC